MSLALAEKKGLEKPEHPNVTKADSFWWSFWWHPKANDYCLITNVLESEKKKRNGGKK